MSGYPKLASESPCFRVEITDGKLNYTEITLPGFEHKVPILRSDVSLSRALHVSRRLRQRE